MTEGMKQVRQATHAQMHAAFAMLADCISKCPESAWEEKIAKYPFWHVAYHTLCFVECYLSPGEGAFEARVRERVASRERGESVPDFQPAGMSELEDESPSRLMTKAELMTYVSHCRDEIDTVLGEGTSEDFGAPSGFSWLPFNRLETHLYNMRHIQHHAGQLSACLRRIGEEPRWVKTGAG